MKYLSNFFNHILIDKNKEQIIHNGRKFENIIELLLNEMFPHLSWKSTRTTNDGNKDFYAISRADVLWAECKNYKNAIELKVLAPTLVMAQLNNANEIYFFSVSKINDSAKKKICFYSEINNILIHFIDDIVLENLLLYYDSTRNYIKKHLKYLEIQDSKDLLNKPDIYKFVMKNPFMNIPDNETIFGKNVSDIEYNDIISSQIYIVNNNINESLEVNISINKQNPDLYRFQYLSQNLNTSINDISVDLSLKPNEVYICYFNFKVVVYKEKIQLPDFVISYKYNEKELIEPFQSILSSCSCVGKTQLIGPSYEKILQDLLTKLTQHKRLSVCIIKGTSGTGKTRLLEESFALLTKLDYKILNFIGISNEDSFEIFKQIVYVLYNVTDEIIEQIYEQYDMNDNVMNTGYKLLYDMKQKKISFEEYLERYGELIFEKLAAKKYAIMIDNVQYYDKNMCMLIDKLVMYSKNNNRKGSIAILLSFNTDYLQNNPSAQLLLNRLNKLEDTFYLGCYNTELHGFKYDDNAGLLYLKQLLNLKDEQYDDSLNRLIKKNEYNPYYIKSFADYIMNLKLTIKYHSNGTIIQNERAFIEHIDSFPDKIKESIYNRFKYVIDMSIDKNKDLSMFQNDILFVLSCIHIFRKISKKDLLILQSNIEAIEVLLNNKFIKIISDNEQKKYVFDHDLIENYFEDYTEDNLCCALNLIDISTLKELQYDYTEAYNLISLNKDINDILEVKKLINYGLENEISYRLFIKYYELCLNKMLFLFDICEKEEWFDVVLKLISRIRERFGGSQAFAFFEKLYFFLDTKEKKVLINYNNFSKILFAICENFHHGGKYSKVISIYESYISLYENFHKTENIQETIAFIYNRLSIAYSHFNTKEATNKRDSYISKSLVIAKNLINQQYYAESLYDKASFYYYKIEDKDIFLKNCKESIECVDVNNIELMTLHNIQRKIRYLFVMGCREDIINLIDEGFTYIEEGTYNEYRFFFKKFFYTAKALYYIFNKEYIYAKKEINNSIEETRYFGSSDIVNNEILLGKIYYDEQKYIKSIEKYKSAYTYTANSNLKEKNFILDTIVDDLSIKLECFSVKDMQFLSSKHLSFIMCLNDLSIDEYRNYISSHKAITIITSDDKKENYPSI